MQEMNELREIIKILIKGKWVITGASIVGLLVFSILTWFVLEEKFESEAVVQISGGSQDAGLMSNYVSTEFTHIIYMQRLQNEGALKRAFEVIEFYDYTEDKLAISNPANTNLVELSYKGETAEEAQRHLHLIMEHTKENMNSAVKTTLQQLEQTYLNEANALSNEIELLMNQYNNLVVSNKLPEVLILQTIASSQFVLNLTTEQTNALANISGSIQNELLQLKAQVDTKSTEYREVLTKYQSVKTGLESFKPDPFIRVIMEPTLKEKAVSPNKIINLGLGLVIGVMIGIAIVFFRKYWKETSL